MAIAVTFFTASVITRHAPQTLQIKRVWIQAVSVGEVIAIGPLLDELSQKATIEIVLTVTTSTGYQTANQRYADKVSMLGYFPFDFWPWPVGLGSAYSRMRSF